MTEYTYITSESVCHGHPDKLCDRIADAILDEAMIINPLCHNAVECTLAGKTAFIYGETDTIVDYQTIAKGILGKGYRYIIKVRSQSSEINNAVGNDEGAGDQGIVFGYACDETAQYMPLSIMFAHNLALALDNINGDKLGADGKTQVTTKYRDGVLESIDTILVSKQHSPLLQRSELEDIVRETLPHIATDLNAEKYLTNDTKLIVNPSGSFILGGPEADSGTTGRKIVVDSYGGHSRVGGGCFSSKDPSKIDRSGAYYARYVALNIVAHGYADKCEVQVAYGIGMKDAISVEIDCYGTNKKSKEFIYKFVQDNFDFSPSNLVKELELRTTMVGYYKDTACYGHFGWDYPWELIKEI